MKLTNPLIYLALIIHILISIVAGADEEIILYIMAVPILANFVGLFFLSFTNKIKLGAKIFMFSSFVFVPIGLIGVLGCRKVLDTLNEEVFFKEENDD